MLDDITDQEINRRIAEFMGWQNLEWREATSHIGIVIPAGWYGDSSIGPGHLLSNYANNVDDLIPVIEKLRKDEKYLEVVVTGSKNYVADMYDKRDKRLASEIEETMAMAICHCVMTFLEKE